MLLQNILPKKIQEKITRGRKRICWINDLRKWYKYGSIVRIAMMIFNLLRADGTPLWETNRLIQWPGRAF